MTPEAESILGRLRRAGLPPDLAGAPAPPGYASLEEVARGGQGVVYSAIQESTRRRVAISDAAADILSSMGYLVTSNKPYAGGFITEHYGRPLKGLHALQIEVNRGLYVDEQTLMRKPGFQLLRDDIAAFIAQMMALPDRHFFDYSVAAE